MNIERDTAGRPRKIVFSNNVEVLHEYDDEGKKIATEVIVPDLTTTTPLENGFRLSASSSSPVTTSDTSSTSINLVPYKSNQIALYSSGAWSLYSSAAISLALSTTAGDVYDVFASYNGSAVVLSTLAWTNTTTRATALGYQDGVLVLSTDSTKLYLGTIYCASANTVNDKAAQRHIWNYYHRVKRRLFCSDTTSSWTYSSTTFRAANNNTTDGVGRVSLIAGVSEDCLHAIAAQQTTRPDYNSIGLDSTSTPSLSVFTDGPASTAEGSLVPAAGYHYLQRIEATANSGSSTFYGYTSPDYTSGYLAAEYMM